MRELRGAVLMKLAGSLALLLVTALVCYGIVALVFSVFGERRGR